MNEYWPSGADLDVPWVRELRAEMEANGEAYSDWMFAWIVDQMAQQNLHDDLKEMGVDAAGMDETGQVVIRESPTDN